MDVHSWIVDIRHRPPEIIPKHPGFAPTEANEFSALLMSSVHLVNCLSRYIDAIPASLVLKVHRSYELRATPTLRHAHCQLLS